ncbi:MAG: type I-C CRISPR-associated protein Cas8c/Csd1 [Gammaproteobacteria bacterium]
MILQALTDYYQRRAADPSSGIAPFGFSLEKLGFVLVLDGKGELIDVADVRETKGSKKIPVSYLLPQAVKRSSGIAANLLWDNVDYVLGMDTKGKPERAAMAHTAFVARLTDELLPICNDPGLAAVDVWLRQDSLALIEQVTRFIKRDELQSANLSFKLAGDPVPLLCQREAVIAAIEQLANTHSKDVDICLVSGKSGPLARLHPSIKGVWGGQSSGGNIISFNLPAFSSYNKDQGANAPISEQSAFAYTTALNDLLRQRAPDASVVHCLQVGDASTVFWAEKTNHPLEQSFTSLFGEPPKDSDPGQGVQAVRALYRAVEQGGYTPDDSNTRFYVLGLAPNASRISIRFWQVATVAELAPRIVRYFNDIEIIRPHFDSGPPSLFRVLLSIAAQNKADNIPPNLAGDTLRTILEGRPYPLTLLQAALRRNRAEQRITPNRAALIKACLIRCFNILEGGKLVSLDTTRTEPAYRLGRLFAALEKLQNEAQGDINRTIGESYFGAASSNPRAVFSTLLKLHKHHLNKLKRDKPGRERYFSALIGEIMNGLDNYPNQLDLAAQGLFSIGYYHQRQAFYTKSEVTSQGE